MTIEASGRKGRFFPRLRAVAAIAVFGIFSAVACGTSRGTSCTSDSDCDSGQVCSSPGCSSSQKECIIPCSTDDDCHSKDSANSKCYGVANCQGYCSSG